jgi:hypothetical protein
MSCPIHHTTKRRLHLLFSRRYGVVDNHFVWEGGSSCGQKGLGIHIIATSQRKEIEEAFRMAAQGNLIQPGKRNKKALASKRIGGYPENYFHNLDIIKERGSIVPGSPKSSILNHGDSKHSLISSSVLASPSMGHVQRMNVSSRCGTIWSSTGW